MTLRHPNRFVILMKRNGVSHTVEFQAKAWTPDRLLIDGNKSAFQRKRLVNNRKEFIVSENKNEFSQCELIVDSGWWLKVCNIRLICNGKLIFFTE